MILSASQPYFAPYPGFFARMLSCDVFVLMDSVQFPRGTTWITRNRFKNDQGTLWMTIPVHKKGLGLQRIDRVQIMREGRWSKKHLASLLSAYRNAPFFVDHRPFLEDLFGRCPDRLLDLNLAIIHYLSREMGIETRIVLLSETGLWVRGKDLPVELCRALEADVFLAQKAAGNYLQAESFAEKGVRLSFFRPPERIYPQLWGDFIGSLSAFDLLFNCGPRSRHFLTGRWEGKSALGD